MVIKLVEKKEDNEKKNRNKTGTKQKKENDFFK